MRFVAIGDNCIDIYTNLGMGFPGGGPVNFAVQAARLGVQTAYIGAIGTDDYGELLSQSLLKENVDISHLQTLAGDTAVAFVEINETERVFIGSDRGVREKLSIQPATDEFIQGFNLLHTTLDGKVDAKIPGWRAAGLKLSYDFSHRFVPQQLYLLPYLEVAFFSGQKQSPADGERLLKQYHGLGAKWVVMTFGKNGSAAFDGMQFHFQEATIPQKLVDTLGAGDAFQAGFMTSYMHGHPIQEALKEGARVATRTISYYGGFGYGKPLGTFTHNRIKSGGIRPCST